MQDVSLYSQFPTVLHAVFTTTGALLENDSSSSEDEPQEEGVLTYAEERIEDDTELKLHSLSNQTLWARRWNLKRLVDRMVPASGPKFLISTHKMLVARYVDTSSGQLTSHLPYRVLPPGSVKMLWVQSGGKCSHLGATRH